MAVRYPAACRALGKVSWAPSKVLRLSGTPFTWLCLPVRTTARAGAQIELVQNALRKSIPSAARESMFGVGPKREP